MAATAGAAQSEADKGGPFEDMKNVGGYLIDPGTGWHVKVLALVVILLVLAPLIGVLPPVLRECVNLIRWAGGRRVSSERRRRRRRQMFARHVDNQLRHLELQEDWRDEKYAELEAEVEIEQTWSRRWMRRVLPFRRSTLRRVRSLSQALRRSGVPLVLLEGEPGAGKSIALRHLARVLAKRASKSKKVNATIPLYVNLKQLDVRPGQVNEERIRAFVLAALNEVNSRDVQEVLDAEFDRGLEEGSWLFLFDSFDEIPDLLSAQDARRIAPLYAQAIADFLGPFTRCRGIVASRDFTSPDSSQYTRFRILRLSARHQRRLIRRADLDGPVHRALRTGLATASQDVATFAGNPMFLGLLCEHMRTSGRFPANSHAVFEDYLDHRLQRDAQRIKARFAVDVGFVRAGAEEIAFLMGSVPRMGLTPSKEMLLESASSLDTLTPRWIGTVLDALEYAKLGRADVNTAGKATFSFVHRRFQEYFATCVVIRERRRVPVVSLLDNDQWRETAVTLLQIQNRQDTTPLLIEAGARLTRFANQADTGIFCWPVGCLHLLRILSTGLESREEAVVEPLRPLVDRILVRAWDEGHRLDKRRALDFVLLASVPVAERLLIEAFRSRNELLREGAFRSAGSLPELSPPLRNQIRLTLLGLAASVAVYRDHASTTAQIKRLAQPSEFLRLLKLLMIAVPVAVLFSAGGFVVNAVSMIGPGPLSAEAIIGFFSITFAAGAMVMTVSTAFSQAALRRGGGNLVASMSQNTLVEHKVLRAAGTAAALAVHAVFCWVSVGHVISVDDHAPVAVTIAVYGALWPPAVIWSTRNGVGGRTAWWPLLPVVMVVLGGWRFPTWLRRRMSDLAGWSGPFIGVQLLAALSHLMRPSFTKLVRAVVLLVAVSLIATWTAIALFSFPRIGIATGALALALFVVIRVLLSSFPLRAAVRTARTGDDALAAFARLRSPVAFDSVVARLGVRHIAREPTAKQAIEVLLGEIEQAQVRAGTEKALLLRTACPSLAGKPPARQWLLDSWPVRRWTSLCVHEVSEDALDELARLADKD